MPRRGMTRSCSMGRTLRNVSETFFFDGPGPLFFDGLRPCA